MSVLSTILLSDYHTPSAHAGPRNSLLVSALPSILTAKTISFLLLAFYLVHICYYCLAHPLRKVPGPFLARFSQAWRNIRYFRGTWLEDVVALRQKYSNVVRITPNEVSFVDVGALKALYGHGKPSQKVRAASDFRCA
jgi:hypothetical protein